MSFYGAQDPWLDPTRWWLQDRGIEVVGLDILTLFQRRRGIAGRDIGDGGGGYIHVEDLAAAYVLALELLLAGGRSDYSTAATAGATPSWK